MYTEEKSNRKNIVILCQQLCTVWVQSLDLHNIGTIPIIEQGIFTIKPQQFYFDYLRHSNNTERIGAST